MRILHISTSDNNGAGKCCLRIHQSLLASGVESKMVTMKNVQHAEGEYQYGFYNVKTHNAVSKILRKVGLRITQKNKVETLSKEYNTTFSLPVSSVDLTKCKWIEWADIIHLHWVNNYLDYPSFFRKMKKPIVWTLHDENLFYGIAHHHKSILLDNPLEQKYSQIKFDAVRSAENLTVVFLSDMMLQNFGNEKIIEGRRKMVINNSVNTQVFMPQDRLAMRHKYGLDEQKTMYVFISIDIGDPNKGLRLLSNSLHEVDPDAEIIAIGGNCQKMSFNNMRSIGLVKSQRKLSEIISCANYMAMPSYQEAFSQSPMEAMACGLPVVVFPVSGTSELVKDYNGVICDSFTSEALKKGIETLKNSNYNSEEIRQDMIKRFSPEAIAQKYKDLYIDLLK